MQKELQLDMNTYVITHGSGGFSVTSECKIAIEQVSAVAHSVKVDTLLSHIANAGQRHFFHRESGADW
jgi:hypothetical protein